MARLRYVDLSGTIGSGNLTNSATSHTFTAPLTYAGGTTVPTLSGSDYFLLSILNTAGTATSEVIKVSAYNSGTGAATIARGREGTTGASHSSGDKVLQSDYPSDLAPSWEDLIEDIGSKVHRYKFDESSGSTIADSIGSLNLTLTGTSGTNYNRNASGAPKGLGGYLNLVSSSYADSSGMGSIPVGSANRTIWTVFRSSNRAQMYPWSYGAAAEHQLFYPGIHEGPGGLTYNSLSPSVGGTTNLMSMQDVPLTDGQWHLMAQGVGGGDGKTRWGWIDGIFKQIHETTAAATGSAGNFRVGQLAGSGGAQFVGDLADIGVTTGWIAPGYLDKMLDCLTNGL